MKTFALNKHKKFSFPFFLSFSFGHRQTTLHPNDMFVVVVEMVNAKRLLAHTLFLCSSFTLFTFRRIEESFPIWNSLTFLAWRTCMSMWKCEWRKVNDIPIELFYHLICSLSKMTSKHKHKPGALRTIHKVSNPNRSQFECTVRFLNKKYE